MKLSLILEAVDRATGPVRRATASIRNLSQQGVKPLEQSLRRVQGVERHFLSGLPARLSLITANVRRLAGRAGLGALRASAMGAASALGRLVGFAGGLAVGGLAIGVTGAGLLGGWLTGGVISQAAKFEQYRVILENTQGSAAAAEKAMAWVKQFSATTPYEIGDVMEAFVKLTAYGIDPTNGSLRALGDAASGMGKNIGDAVEMLADAQTGEFERVKEFGIRASVQGNVVRLTYQKAGKEITRVAKNNGMAIQAALMGIFGEKFAGMMDRQSRTFQGMWRNIGDAVTFAQLAIADAGFFDAVKGKLQVFLGWITKISNDGTMKRWAKDISERLTEMTNKAYEFVTNIDWDNVVRGVGRIAAALVDLIGWIGQASTKWNRWQLEMERNRLGSSVDSLYSRFFGSSKDRLNALDRIREINRQLGNPDEDARIPSDLKGVGKPDVKGISRDWIQQLQRSMGPRQQAPAKPAPPPKGKISLEITTPPGVTATPRGVSATGMNLEVVTGRAMSGVA